MKKILLLMALVAGTATLSMAQQGGGQRGGTPEERVQRNLERLKTAINLTADQEVKVKQILFAQNKSQDSLMAAAGNDRQAAFQKMAPIRESSDARIMALLNDDQKKAYTAMQEQRRQRMGGQNGGQRPPGQ